MHCQDTIIMVSLQRLGIQLINDHSINGTNFSGEIWAMTFWQDDELDFSDAYENAWVKKMESMDNDG